MEKDIFSWAFVWYPVYRSMEAQTAERDTENTGSCAGWQIMGSGWQSTGI